MRRARLGRGVLLGAFAILFVGGACASFSAAEDPPPAAEAGPDVTTPVVDGGTDTADVVVDDVVTKCNRDDPFQPPVPVAGLSGSSTSYIGAWNTPDGILVSAADGANIQVKLARRLAGGGLETPALVSIMGEPFVGPISPTLSSDGTTLFFSAYGQDAGAAASRSLFMARRNGTAYVFGNAIPLPTLANDILAVSIGEGSLHYAALDSDGKGYDLYAGSLGAAGLTNDKSVTSLNTANYNESAGVLGSDGLRIYFATNRAGSGAKGRDDIWLATRPSTTSPWSTPRPLVELNSVAFDVPTWVSEDECTMLLVTNRRQASPDTFVLDVYIAERPRTR